MAAGGLATGKMAAALRRLGFKKVFDTQFSADLTIMEEAYELISRIKNKGPLPLITSCSPGWVNLPNIFTPRSSKIYRPVNPLNRCLALLQRHIMPVR